MAGNKQQVPWKDVVAKAANDSGLPKKTIEESFAAVTNTIEVIGKEQRPKEIGGELVIKTPLVAIKIKHVAEKVVTNPKTGEQWQRGACYGASGGVSKTLMDAINTGISLEKKPLSGAKTAAKEVDIKPAAKAKTA